MSVLRTSSLLAATESLCSFSSLKAKKLVTDKEKVTGMEEAGKVDKEDEDPVWTLEEGCEEEVAAEEGDEEEVEVSFILVDF